MGDSDDAALSDKLLEEVDVEVHPERITDNYVDIYRVKK